MYLIQYIILHNTGTGKTCHIGMGDAKVGNHSNWMQFTFITIVNILHTLFTQSSKQAPHNNLTQYQSHRKTARIIANIC